MKPPVQLSVKSKNSPLVLVACHMGVSQFPRLLFETIPFTTITKQTNLGFLD